MREVERLAVMAAPRGEVHEGFSEGVARSWFLDVEELSGWSAQDQVSRQNNSMCGDTEARTCVVC